jgi:6-phosphogluconate dehydrogenase
MGANIALHAGEKGHGTIGFDPSEAARQRFATEGGSASASLNALVAELPRPRILMLYVPHGEATEEDCRQLRPLLEAGDIVCDGGNSYWPDSVRHAAFFAEAGVRFLDVGTSGGVSGAREGACFMVGGEREAFDVVAPLLCDLAVDAGGVYYAGPAGSGHFSKLVHNAIEFGMVQAIAEGVEMLRRGDYELDLPALLENWQHGSVVRSWLVGLMANALRENPDLSPLSTYVEDTGEVKWVLQWALERDIPSPVITTSQTALSQYRDRDSATAKSVALLRNQYGGHPVHRKAEDPKP